MRLATAEKLTNEGELSLALAVREEAAIADADEAPGQDVQEKPADELHRIETHGASTVPLRVVFPAKGDSAVVRSEERRVGKECRL